MSAAEATSRAVRVEPRTAIGLLAAAVYIALAAGLANLLTSAIAVDDPVGDLVLGHLPVLIPLIVAGVVFVRWAGWGSLVWRTPAAGQTAPRRWWLWAFPVLLLVQSGVTLAGSQWSRWTVGAVLVVAGVCVLVGVGEELYFRGILRAAVRRRHGETLALLISSLVFGVAHSVALLASGASPGSVVFTVAVTTLAGAVYYGVFRATGRLWVAMALHALDDFALHIAGADVTAHPLASTPTSPVTVATQSLLWALTAVLLVSCIRQDRAARLAARS